MQVEAIRVYALAKKLNMESKELLEICQKAGFHVLNQLSSISPEQCDAIERLLNRTPTGGQTSAVAPPSVRPSERVTLVPQAASRRPTAPTVHPRKVPPTAVVVAKGAYYPPSRDGRPVPPAAAKAPRPAPKVESTPGPAVTTQRALTPPRTNPGIEALLNVGEKAGFVKLEIIALVAEIDPESAIFKIRKLAERICRSITKVQKKVDFNALIEDAKKQRLLPAKTIKYLHQIREVGNIAVHVDDPFDGEFNMDDVHHAAMALACVLKECLAQKLLVPKS